jgi:predicted KAP-like P-loop ATPase
MPRDTAFGNPAVHPDEDEFNRWPFGRALADRIAGIGSAEGAAVIGLYGKWGSGKSTVLNFIKYRLEHEHARRVVLFEFNPWFFTSQEELLAAFFTGLASRLEQSLESPVKDAGALLKKYSGLFGMIPVVGSGASRLAEQLGDELAANSLQNQRERVFDMMRTAQRTTVVLIDDLDRLDRAEIMTMLKLVRLTANLPRVVYLLAFDDDVVAQVVASANAVDVRDAGRQFLEKIVQFPFTLPAVGQKRLVDYVLRQADNAVDRAGISLTDQDWSAFRSLTDYHLSRRLTTPRQAIRYASALDFALPMVKGEVNPLQQMAVEGMRILFPELYVFVRDNSGIFNLGSPSEEVLAGQAARAMKSAREEDISAGKGLLSFLFQKYGTPPVDRRSALFRSLFRLRASP